MPNASPRFTTCAARFSDAVASSCWSRATGTASNALKKARRGRLASDRPSQYSAFARKTTRRGTQRGMTMLSMKERWLLATIEWPGGRDVLPALDDRPPAGCGTAP